jgi:L-rhamnose-H+ transport protein
MGDDPLLADAYFPLETWKNSVTMALFLSGGGISTLLWCLALNRSNRTLGDYANAAGSPLLANYLWCAIAGAVMYSEFFFYGIAEPQMGKDFSYTNLPIHLALVIIMGNLWAIAFREWKGTSLKTRSLITAGIVTLIVSTAFMGYSSYLDNPPSTIAPGPG